MALGEGDIAEPQAVRDRMSEACAAQSAAHLGQRDIDYHRSVLGLSLAATFPLCEIAYAQRASIRKRHIGNFVLIP